MKKFFLACILSGMYFTMYGQGKYWVYFTSKTTANTYSIHNKDSLRYYRDAEINRGFLHILHVKYGITSIVQSRWLNAITCYLGDSVKEEILNEDFIHTIKAVDKDLSVATTPVIANRKELSRPLEQIKGGALIAMGLDGKGVDIGIIDRGFLNANDEERLGDIFWDNTFIEFRNFTNSEATAFGGLTQYSDDHGTKVWTLIGGNSIEEDVRYGLASRANYYLAKSDRGDKEFRGEEDYWIAAVEWMDSLGIKIINSSLGYSTGFDNPEENYIPEDIDGKTSPITQAAQIAAEEKGILLILAAGNEGNSDFKVISVPADSKDVLTVGATTFTTLKKMSFSSIGSGQMAYAKPDIAVYSRSGTSFTAPVITGLAACMKQYNPELSNQGIIDIIQRSSHLYPYPNNFVGYGVPDSEKIVKLLKNPATVVSDSEFIEAMENMVILSSQKDSGLLYHKKDSLLVLEEVEISEKNSNGSFLIERFPGAVFTTFTDREKVVEIKWPD